MRTATFIILLVVSNFGFGQKICSGKTYFYTGQYCDSINNIFIKDTIEFVTTGIQSEFDSKKTAVIWKYHLKYDSLLCKKSNIEYWGDNETTGVKENEEMYWVQPPRINQYRLTELAPHPRVKLPCILNKKYSLGTIIRSGYGDWDGLTINLNYEIVNKDSIIVGTKNYPCWIIKSEGDSNSKFGKSYLTAAFNEDIGFVELLYSFYNGVKIELKLYKIE